MLERYKLKSESSERNRWGAVVFGLITFAVYSYTISPTIRFWDTAELTAAAFTLGIPHPPGFPLYTLFGRVLMELSWLPPALSINLFSALCAAGSIVFTLSFMKEYEDKRETGGNYFAGFLLAFGGILWTQAVRAEVYAPAFSALALALLMASRFRNRGDFRYFCGAIYLWSIGATTHLAMAASVLPALIYLILANGKGRELSLRKIITGSVVFIIGLSAFLYLPIRGGLSPVIEWGESESLSGFLSMISAREFAFSLNLSNISERIADLPRQLGGNFPLPILGFILLGLLKGKNAVPVLLLFGGSVTALTRQELPHTDYGGYLLPVVLALSIWAGRGFDLMVDWFRRQKLFRTSRYFPEIIGTIFFVALLVPLFAVQFPRHNLRNSYWAERLGRDTLGQTPDSSLLIFNDVSSYFSCQYLQAVEGFRKDCDLVQIYALAGDSRSRKWYWESLKRKGSIAGLDDLPLSEERIMGHLIQSNYANRPIYCEYGDAFRPFCHYLIPAGLLYRVDLNGDSTSVPISEYDYPSKAEVGFDREAAVAYGERLYTRGLYYNDIGEIVRAGEYFAKASEWGGVY